MTLRMARVLLAAALVASVLTAGTPSASASPANDDRAAATPILGLPYEVAATNVGATEEAIENVACTQDGTALYGATVWFRYEADAGARLRISTVDASVDTVLAVYEGDELLPAACNNNADETFRSEVKLEVSAGASYHIQVGGKDGATGDFALRVERILAEEPPPAGSTEDRPVTVVAVVDSGFSPYHFDFVGHQHPWNTDADPSNDIDLTADPASFIEGHPGAVPVPLTLPVHPSQRVDHLRSGIDEAAWDAMTESSTAEGAELYWFPGTKVVGAVSFDGDLYGSNSSHGTRSAASAVGNIHGTCPTCLVVFVKGASSQALRWAASQPWIDVVTNSYGHSTGLRDNIYLGAPLDATKQASEDGGTIVFSAGNGHLNAFILPPLTYWSSEKGPDWIVTVGAVTPGRKQSYSGHGKPVDISSIGSSYPSTGGATATGTGTHSGTSNAAPTVAGYFGSVIQGARELLDDETAGRAGGIVASGDPVTCGPADEGCVLGDGVLTKAELDRIVYHGARPSPFALETSSFPWWPSTEHAYAYQGHGVLAGHLGPWQDELDRMLAVAKGDAAAYERPAGEANWFTVDSKCRQRIWGPWSSGYHDGEGPELDLQADPLASVFDAWCSVLPQGPYTP